ncbi:chemotaxis protein CheW [Candidatus Riflebacteria bacterium]
MNQTAMKTQKMGKDSDSSVLLNLVELVTFKMQGEDYAFYIRYVDTIIPVLGVKITRVPKSAGYIKGVINLRGEVIPVIDLRKRLKFETREFTDDARIMILFFKEEKTKCGILVDSVSEVVRIPESDVSRPQASWAQGGGLESSFILSIGQRDGINKEGEPHRQLIIVLDGEAIAFGKKQG